MATELLTVPDPTPEQIAEMKAYLETPCAQEGCLPDPLYPRSIYNCPVHGSFPSYTYGGAVCWSCPSRLEGIDCREKITFLGQMCARCHRIMSHE